MENRFTFKDFVLCALAAAALAAAGLAWVQIKRQGELVEEISQRLERQDELLRRIDARAQVAAPAPLAPPAAPPSAH